MSDRPAYWAERLQEAMERIIANVENVLIGKRPVIEQAVIALVCGGHILLEDVPGVGKTMLARALAKSVDGRFSRIQSTADLLPTDLTGTEMLNRKTGAFEFRPGPIFAHVVLVDEMNRMPSKTQAALLEAMEEGQITSGGVTYRLPEPFIVIATQNPADYDSAFPLPEAQLDRFLLRLSIGYPDRQDEIAMLDRLQTRHPVDRLRPVTAIDEWLQAQREVRTIHVDDALKQYIVGITAATRGYPGVALGASPRTSLALMRAAQARAALAGRGFVVPDDIKALAEPVLAHRLVLSPDARADGLTGKAVLTAILHRVPVPGIRFASGS